MPDLLALGLALAWRPGLDPARLMRLAERLRRRRARMRRPHPRLGGGEIGHLIGGLFPTALRGRAFDPGDPAHLDGLRRACAAALSLLHSTEHDTP